MVLVTSPTLSRSLSPSSSKSPRGEISTPSTSPSLLLRLLHSTCGHYSSVPEWSDLNSFIQSWNTQFFGGFSQGLPTSAVEIGFPCTCCFISQYLCMCLHICQIGKGVVNCAPHEFQFAIAMLVADNYTRW